MPRNDAQLNRVRKLCLSLPDTSERISHGEPTFFVGKKVFVMLADNHHNDGRVAIWLPVTPGYQTVLINNEAEKYFKPPYVGTRGWIGIILPNISDDDLTVHIEAAWEMIATPVIRSRARSGGSG